MNKTMYGYKSEVELTEDFHKLLLEPFLSTLNTARTKCEYKRQILTVCTYFYHLRGSRFSFEELDAEAAKEYFLVYLSKECENGKCSKYTFRLRLSCCKSFSAFLEKRLPALILDGMWPDIGEYTSPFTKIVLPARGELLSTREIVSESEIDRVLSLSREHDRQLFIILLFSFRMMLPQNIILSLRKECFFIQDDNGRKVGIVTYLQKGKQVYKRIPADILVFLEDYLKDCDNGHIFRNKYGNPMNSTNLSHLLERFAKLSGCRITLGRIRARGIIDLVAHNPDSLDEIEDYTGLSKLMIKGYGEALDRIAVDCIADKSTYGILSKKERND